MKTKISAIPVVDAVSHRIVGGFCSNREVVTRDEETALDQLRHLREEATRIKNRLAEADPDQRNSLEMALASLRQEATHWRQQREQATRNKHIALGHVSLSLG